MQPPGGQDPGGDRGGGRGGGVGRGGGEILPVEMGGIQYLDRYIGA